MKTEYLIDSMDKLGTRRILKAYKYAYKGAGKPDGIPQEFWEKIKIWDNFSSSSKNFDDIIKSDYDIDAETAKARIDDAKKGNKKAYLDEAYKLATKRMDKSSDAKNDAKVLADKKKAVASNEDIKYNEEKIKLTQKYKDKEIINSSEKRGDMKMEISQKDFKKIMKAMNTINKHFAEEKDEEDEVIENELPKDEEQEVVEDEKEEEEVVEDEAADDNEEEEPTTTIELPEDVALAIKEALEESDLDDEDSDIEDEVGEDEEESENEDEEVEEDDSDYEDEEEEEVDMCGVDNFSMKRFFRFSEAITETIENLNKKVEKISKEIQNEANDRTVEFSTKEFLKFAETVTETIENIAKRVDEIETNPIVKNEVTKDLSNLESTSEEYEDNFITKSDEEPEMENEECCDPNVDPNCDPNEDVICDTEQFSKRYDTVKNFLTL